MKANLRVRMSQADAHYGGDLVDGARMMALFGDVATELLIRQDGDEGLFVAYDQVTFTAPVFAGDFIEVVGRIEKVGHTSRKMSFTAYKVIAGSRNADEPSRATLLSEPMVVAKASGTCVVPLERQREGK
ncbi:hotdog domain-containing protein [Mechercharimyces sp. CAU 1602]|uniref:3-aminobutyryl-CoA ammonia lyase n=1 Tax=Mechercharimyces sp. CAU 1602 TaxID=2973933 RepID=UPI002161B8B9|nr:hotdog domain-containing protein [Mechercharimyces sp. CAU 1602]MCS1352328.1 3-aminobutyryl-CoA ammonia lyase [Mechercharimyces sp. CAU 1602]